MKRTLLSLVVVILYVLHQDFWFWRTARPLLFGFLPPGIWYHLGFTLAVSLVMWLLIRQAWPGHLDEELEERSQPEAAQFSGISATEEDEAR
jgi:hypothetical protein